MYTIDEIHAMSPSELEAASKRMEAEVGKYVLKQIAIRVGLLIAIRVLARKYWGV